MREMVVVVLVLVLAVSCKTQSANQPEEASEERSGETRRVEAWTSNEAVEVDELETRTYFVVSDAASVCPTMEQAAANECGNSVEDPEAGLSFLRGQTVDVVGDEPVDGMWRALRYTKMGPLPGWVASERVATEPDVSHVAAFSEAHPDARTYRTVQIELLTKDAPYTSDRYPLEPTAFLVGDGGDAVVLRTPACFGVKELQEYRPYERYHGCLLYADCGSLAYVCENGGYCDQMSVVWEPAGQMEYRGEMYDVGQIRALADRFGVFSQRECG
jgi:hypothetical protein